MQGRIFIIATAYDAHCAAEDTGMGVERESGAGWDFDSSIRREAQTRVWIEGDNVQANAEADANERDWMAMA